MNKEEILARSRKENQQGDERMKIIEKEANQNAFLAIEGINAFLIMILFLQKLFAGKAFADYQVFLLAFLTSSNKSPPTASNAKSRRVVGTSQRNKYFLVSVVGCRPLLTSCKLL